MKLISFSFNKWQYPFIMSVLYFGQTYCLFNLEVDYQNDSNMLFPTIISFSLIIAIIPEIISQVLRKRKRNHQTNGYTNVYSPNGSAISFVVSKPIHSKVTIGVLYLLLGFLTFFQNTTLIKGYFLQSYSLSSLQSFLGILLTSLLCYIIHQTKLYRHHFLSISLIAVDICIYYSLEYTAFTQKVKDIYGTYPEYAIILLVYLITSSFKEVIENDLMIYQYVSASLILFIEGVISLALYAIYIPCAQLVTLEGRFLGDMMRNSKWELYVTRFKMLFECKGEISYYAFAFLALTLFSNYFRIQTNKKLSPTHRFMVEMGYSFYWKVFDIFYSDINGPYTWKKFGLLFNAFFLVISCFIFNEYIIFHFGGLNDNTFDGIDKRGTIELEEIDKQPIISDQML